MLHIDPQALTGKVKSPAKLAHAVLQTARFKPMVAFYKAFLGAHASYEDDHVAFLTYDDEHHRIAIVALPHIGEKVKTAAGLHHLAFAFNNLEDLVLAYQQRKVRDILPVWCVNHGPTTSLYYQDPDGNQIETQVDNFETQEEEFAFFCAEDFKLNPVGVDFDPEELARRVQSGEDQKQIKMRPNIGVRSMMDLPLPPTPLVKDSYEPSL